MNDITAAVFEGKSYLPTLCDSDSPVWIFGRSYSIKYDFEELRRTIVSCLWMTYRKNFPPLKNTSLTSDRGWGCMIRTGQMLLAKALILRRLERNWHWNLESQNPNYLHLISLFGDRPTALFSLHRIAESGATLGKPVGSWLGPNTVCQAIKKLLCEHKDSEPSIDMEIFIAMDSMLIKSEVKRCCKSPQVVEHGSSSKQGSSLRASSISFNCFPVPRTDPSWKPLLLIVPLRLGLSNINEAYIPAIKAVFENPLNIGVIGGRPNHALYFVGYSGEDVLFLDPHTVQSSSAVGSKVCQSELDADNTYHLETTERMNFLSMDPSVAVCFYCQSEKDFDTLCSSLLERFAKTSLPLFEIGQIPCEYDSFSTNTPLDGALDERLSSSEFVTGMFDSSNFSSVTSLTHPNKGSYTSENLDDDDFEILG